MSSVDAIFRFIEVGAIKIQHDKDVLIIGRFAGAGAPLRENRRKSPPTSVKNPDVVGHNANKISHLSGHGNWHCACSSYKW
jgi:hypothetical protein